MVTKEEFIQTINDINTSLTTELQKRGVNDIDTSSTTNILKSISKCNPNLNIEYGVSSCDDTSKLCIDYNRPNSTNFIDDTVKQEVLSVYGNTSTLLRHTDVLNFCRNDKIYYFFAQNRKNNTNPVVTVYDMKLHTFDIKALNDINYYDVINASGVAYGNDLYINLESHIYHISCDDLIANKLIDINKNATGLQSVCIEVCDGYLYIMGGYDKNAVNWIQKIDLQTNDLIDVNITLPYSLYGAVSITYNSNIYIIGGTDSSQCYDTIIKYNTIDNTCSVLDIKLPNTSNSLCSVRIEDKLYIIDNSNNYILLFDTQYESLEEFVHIDKIIKCPVYYNGRIYFYTEDVFNSLSYIDMLTKEIYYSNNICFPQHLNKQLFTTCNNKLYVIGGEYYSGKITTYKSSYMNIIDIENNTLERIYDRKYFKTTSAITSVGDYIYIFGGGVHYTANDDQVFGDNVFNKVLKINTVTKQSEYLEDLTIPFRTPDNCVIGYGTDIYIFGGGNRTGNLYPTTNIYKFDTITEKFEELPVTLPKPGNSMKAVVYGSYIYIIGGKYYDSDTGYTQFEDSIYRFNTSSCEIETLSVKLHKPLYTFAYGVINNNLYIISGSDSVTTSSGPTYYPQIQKINLDSLDSEIIEYKLPFELYEISSFTIDNCIYITNGSIYLPNNFAYPNYGILKFDFNNLLNKDEYMLKHGNEDITCTLINCDNVHIDTHIKDLYVGDMFSSPVNISHLAYLYKDDEWKTLQQLNDEGVINNVE